MKITDIKIPTGYYRLPIGSGFLKGDKYWSNIEYKWVETCNHINGDEYGWVVQKEDIYIRKISENNQNNMKQPIEINGKKYNLNVTRATELGVLEEAAAPYRITDVKNGDVFQWKHIRPNATWEEGTFIMVDKTIMSNGQAVQIDKEGVFQKTWFSIPDNSVYVRIWDFRKEEFIEFAPK